MRRRSLCKVAQVIIDHVVEPFVVLPMQAFLSPYAAAVTQSMHLSSIRKHSYPGLFLFT